VGRKEATEARNSLKPYTPARLVLAGVVRGRIASSGPLKRLETRVHNLASGRAISACLASLGARRVFVTAPPLPGRLTASTADCIAPSKGKAGGERGWAEWTPRVVTSASFPGVRGLAYP
jgi:hypothetical protein